MDDHQHTENLNYQQDEAIPRRIIPERKFFGGV